MNKGDTKEKQFDVNNIIQRLLDVRGAKPGKGVNLQQEEILAICVAAREIFMSQPVLLELEAPLKVCGKYRTLNRT